MDASKNVIKGFEKLTKQEMFDISARHILSTGRKSVNNKGTCVYAGSGCAATPFLTPAAVQWLDNKEANWTALLHDLVVPEHEAEFVALLQDCHDNAHEGPVFMEEWKERMLNLASLTNLSTAVFDKQEGAPCLNAC